METITRVKIQKYTTKELAKINNASKTTFNNDLKPYRTLLGKPKYGHRWSEEQVAQIFGFLGRPYEIIEVEKLHENIKALLNDTNENKATDHAA